MTKGSKASKNTENVDNTSINTTTANEVSSANAVVTPSKGDTCSQETSSEGATSDDHQENG